MQFVWGLLLKFYYSVFPQTCCRMDQLKENCEAVCIKCFDTVSWSSENSYNSNQLSSILLNCDLEGLWNSTICLSASDYYFSENLVFLCPLFSNWGDVSKQRRPKYSGNRNNVSGFLGKWSEDCVWRKARIHFFTEASSSWRWDLFSPPFI